MQIEIIRHGETIYQDEKRYQGISNIPLSDKGKTNLIPCSKIPDWLIVTSMLRTQQTASIIFPNIRQKIWYGLEEMNFGEFEGHNYAELKDNEAYIDWLNHLCCSQCPKGESKLQFTRRINDSFCNLVDEAIYERKNYLVVIAHGGTQMAIMENFCKQKKDYFSWQLKCGQGYLVELDEEEWKSKHIISLIQIVNYTKEE